jgi:hypothetical protein
MLGAALFVAAGGFIHLREWLATYRHVPASAPGSALVRVGFPLNAAASAALAVALVICALWLHRLIRLVVAAAVLFEAGSLATLILSRTGSVLGWMEPIWTRGANQTRAVELGALVSLFAVQAIGAVRGRAAQSPTAKLADTRPPSIPTAA